jgi:plastocyanin/mono/diheme cytochrome c family protein
MIVRLLKNKALRFVPLVMIVSLIGWTASIVFAAAPQPNPLAPLTPGANPYFAPVPGIDLTSNGAAATIHGNPLRGRALFAENCATCHNDRGLGNLPNPGSDDGTVPPLNPIDPGFLEDSQGDPAQFAKLIDVFIQHGSRPAGDSPQLDMIGWGDHKVLSQSDLADIEAYVMQLNGVYWPDRWAPPAEIRMTAQRDVDRDEVLYTITLVNHSAGVLGNLDLVDTLPNGLSYGSSGFPSPDQNPGKVAGASVMWNNQDGVPQGGTLGPFTILANISPDQTIVPANVAQLNFTWTAADGTTFKSSVVSDPVVPATPKPAARLATAVTPVPASALSAGNPTSVATATTFATPKVEETESPDVKATETAAPQPPTPTPLPPTPTPLPSVPTPASFGIQIVQPGDSAMSWGYAPPSITIHVGDSITWTNAGSLQHTVTADDGSFDSGLFNGGASWTMTFNTAGTFSYHCAPHPWMKGSVVVQSAQ